MPRDDGSAAFTLTDGHLFDAATDTLAAALDRRRRDPDETLAVGRPRDQLT